MSHASPLLSHRLLFFDSYHHCDRLDRAVGLISRGSDNLVDDVEPAEHLAEYRIPAVEPAVLSHADKKL